MDEPEDEGNPEWQAPLSYIKVNSSCLSHLLPSPLRRSHVTTIPIVTDIKAMQDTTLAPLRIATSPTLLKAYLRTFLALLTSIALFAIAVLAYVTFYYSYIPVRAIQVPVFLQFEPQIPAASAYGVPSSSKWTSPHGVASIKGLVERQKYDVEVSMILPRSEKNLGAGNFMLQLEMRGPDPVVSGLGGGVKGFMGWEEEWEVDDFSWGGESGREKERVGSADGDAKVRPVVLARSRRPAIMTFRSWLTEGVYRGWRLPLYVLGFGVEAESVKVKMMEGVEFESGKGNVPASLRLEVKSAVPLEVYGVSVRLDARLEGLRWVMYRHWIVTAVVLIGLFWGVEMVVVMFTWMAFSLLFGGFTAEVESQEVKREGVETPKSEPESQPMTPLSETPRTFPTLSSQRRLDYSGSAELSSGRFKRESATPRLEDIPVKMEGEADDEDEDEDADFLLQEPVPSSAVQALTDSGIGTSMESSVGEGRWERGLVRRKSRGRGKTPKEDG